jgi:predicted nucleic acid-binding protein
MSERATISIDTNILLRHFLQDHEDHSARASALLLAVRRGEHRIFCPATVVFEAIHLLYGRLRIPRADIADAFLDLISVQDFVMDQESVIAATFPFWVEQPALDFADCYHLALTKSLGLDAIYTFDRKMDRYPGVARLEPSR